MADRTGTGHADRRGWLVTVPITPAAPALGYTAAPSFDYMPALDGMRAVSVLLVIFSHVGLGHLVPGGFGVTAFFFISGFLITRQLLAEQQARGQVALPAFYVRRLLRLYPALLVMLGLGGAYCYALGVDINWTQILAGVFYYTNYNTWFVPYNWFRGGLYHPFAPLWSLAVEEHYYLVYPGLVFLLGRTRWRFILALCLIIVVVSLWREHLAGACALAVPRCIGDDTDERILQGTDTRIDSILYGALFATLLGTRAAPALLAVLQSRIVFVLALAALLFSFVFRNDMFRDTTRFTVQGIALMFVVGPALFSARLGWVRTLLSTRPALLIGRWSYSLYLWHSLVLLTAVALLPAAFWQPVIVRGVISLPWLLLVIPAVLAGSVALAAASYYYVEVPMVAVRRRFGSHAVRDGAAAQAQGRIPATASKLA